MPQAFALDLDRSQRETVILQSLLMQVPDVKKVTIDRLYAAGLTTLEAMFLATPGDLAATAGIPEDVARPDRRALPRVPAAGELHGARRDARGRARAARRARRASCEASTTATSGRAESWAADAADQKRELRKARAQTLLDIQVLLARLGEVDRLAELERLAVREEGGAPRGVPRRGAQKYSGFA